MLFTRFIFSILLVMSYAASGAVTVVNANSYYDCCCLYDNATNVIHIPAEGTAQMPQINGQLSLALVENQPTCANWKAYVGLCELLNAAAISKVVINTANSGKPIFIISND